MTLAGAIRRRKILAAHAGSDNFAHNVEMPI